MDRIREGVLRREGEDAQDLQRGRRPLRQSLKYLGQPLLIGAVIALAVSGAAQAQAHAPALTDLSLEDLFAQEVSSVAKRPQNVQNAPSAVFVIGREDIRRSGATSLPELLRMVPGVEVADLVGGRAAVTARGFNGEFANKLLVLIDGRAVYLSASSGVPWDQQLVPVEDIERIEVVRGPGAVLWGANAVNGVINVITKHAVDTLGGGASTQADTGGAGRVYVRRGFRIGETGALRLYGVAGADAADDAFFGAPVRDRARAGQIGFRYDAEFTDRDAVTLQGDIQSGRFTPVTEAIPLGNAGSAGDFSGQNLLGRWTHELGEGERTTLQVYFDRLERPLFVGVPLERRLFDVDFSHQFQLAERHDVVWGLGYRRTENRSEPSLPLYMKESDQDWYGGFIQDDIRLLPDRLILSLGAKLEHNPKTGVEFQPSLRAIWTDPAGWSLWGAVSRAARTPADFETDAEVDLRPVPLLAVSGEVNSESLTALEMGWRGRIASGTTLDVTAFYNRYSDLIAYSGSYQIVDGATVLLYTATNLTQAHAYGLEASVDARLRPWWTVKAAASWLEIETDPIAGLFQPIGSLGGERSPGTQVSVRSMVDIGDAVDFDVWIRHVGALGDGLTPAYANLDLRLAWRPTSRLELALRGTNLLGREDTEMRTDVGPFLVGPSARPDRRLQFTASVRY